MEYWYLLSSLLVVYFEVPGASVAFVAESKKHNNDNDENSDFTVYKCIKLKK
jgi:hypothetical protein